jgi:pantoate--beta-alanine ligase
MGALHDGHLSLIERARADGGLVVVSIFVNPTQFGDPDDLAAYPRDEASDVKLATKAGADVVFAPGVGEVYPEGFSTSIRIDSPLTETLEGASRGPEHFWGVAIVVAKLFGMVQPDAAYFGQKDAQQCAVIRRLVADLDLPVAIVACPTVREPDGLAMSSRNVRLNPDDRSRAAGLYAALLAIDDAVASGEQSVERLVEAGRSTMDGYGIEPEYLEGVDPTTLAPVAAVGARTLFVTAAKVGAVRLIDNLLVSARR